jgi:hypothetical protein
MLTAVALLIQTCSEPEATRMLRQLGFETAAVAPGAMTVSAPPTIYRKSFGVDIEQNAKEGAWFLVAGQRSRSLPTVNLPDDLRRCIAAIEFQEPIDFGPPDY